MLSEFIVIVVIVHCYCNSLVSWCIVAIEYCCLSHYILPAQPTCVLQGCRGPAAAALRCLQPPGQAPLQPATEACRHLRPLGQRRLGSARRRLPRSRRLVAATAACVARRIRGRRARARRQLAAEVGCRRSHRPHRPEQPGPVSFRAAEEVFLRRYQRRP